MPKPASLDKKQLVEVEVQRSVSIGYSLEVIEGHIADLTQHKANTEAEIALWQGYKDAVTAKLSS